MENKMTKLKPIDWKLYDYFKDQYKSDPNKWLSKEKILQDNPLLFSESAKTSHDKCSALNSIRLRLNKACAEGQLSHLILLQNGCFKIAANYEEAYDHLKKDYEIGIKRLIRYYENIKVLRRNGQGKLIDCKGNLITEQSLAKRFNDVFNL